MEEACFAFPGVFCPVSVTLLPVAALGNGRREFGLFGGLHHPGEDRMSVVGDVVCWSVGLRG